MSALNKSSIPSSRALRSLRYLIVTNQSSSYYFRPCFASRGHNTSLAPASAYEKSVRHYSDQAPMTQHIHFVRHAQGYHNVDRSGYRFHDPDLTPLGEEQCKQLSETFPYSDAVDLVVASPLKRTINTALLSFPRINRPIIALPEIQETSDWPCDTGSDKDDLIAEFRDKNVDLTLVTDDWNNKLGAWAPIKSSIEARCMEARKWLMERNEKNIVVVTHGGVVHYLTEEWAGFLRSAGTGWKNTEYRTYTFDPSRSVTASLVETEESKARRQGRKQPPSEAKQADLGKTTHAEVGKDGPKERGNPKIQAKV